MMSPTEHSPDETGSRGRLRPYDSRIAPLPSIVEGYWIKERIGLGSQAIVHRAVRREDTPDSRPVELAIKCFIPAGGFEQEQLLVGGFHHEADLLATLEHPNVIGFYGRGQESICSVDYMFLELCAGDADRLDVRSREARVQVAASLAYDIASALQYIHYRGVLHGDVKPANILVSPSGQAKLCDFGLASSNDVGNVRYYGTANFMAPEKIRNGENSVYTDIYSLGATVWQIISGEAPYFGLPDQHVLRETLTHGIPPLDEEDAPADICALVANMTHRCPHKRANLERVKEECRQYRAEYIPTFRRHAA